MVEYFMMLQTLLPLLLLQKSQPLNMNIDLTGLIPILPLTLAIIPLTGLIPIPIALPLSYP